MARTRTEERMGETYGEASEGRNQATSNRAPAGGGAPRLPKQPKIEQITEAKDTSQPGNAAANIAAAYKPKPPKAVTEAEVKSEIVAVCLRGQPSPSPVKINLSPTFKLSMNFCVTVNELVSELSLPQ